jgi:transposase-like protein
MSTKLVMAQLHLPLFPNGATEITPNLSFCRDGEDVTYFCCDMPIFTHARDDRASFLVAIAQLHVTCGAKQAVIARAFGIPAITVKRAVKLFRAKGAPGFYAQRNYRGATVLTDPVLQQVQSLLDEGVEARAVAEQLGIKFNTLDKAIRAGRLHKAVKKKTSSHLNVLNQT